MGNLAEIPLNYGLNGSITAQDGTCSLCGQDGRCLVVDGSDGEYGEIICCRACVEYCFEQVAAPTDGEEEAR